MFYLCKEARFDIEEMIELSSSALQALMHNKNAVIWNLALEIGIRHISFPQANKPDLCK